MYYVLLLCNLNAKYRLFKSIRTLLHFSSKSRYTVSCDGLSNTSMLYVTKYHTIWKSVATHGS